MVVSTKGASLTRIEEALAFYKSHYTEIGRWSLRRGERKVVLGEPSYRLCRFCRERPPHALFRQDACIKRLGRVSKTILAIGRSRCGPLLVPKANRGFQR